MERNTSRKDKRMTPWTKIVKRKANFVGLPNNTTFLRNSARDSVRSFAISRELSYHVLRWLGGEGVKVFSVAATNHRRAEHDSNRYQQQTTRIIFTFRIFWGNVYIWCCWLLQLWRNLSAAIACCAAYFRIGRKNPGSLHETHYILRRTLWKTRSWCTTLRSHT